jgi:hypothetical protein
LYCTPDGQVLVVIDSTAPVVTVTVVVAVFESTVFVAVNV